MGAGIARMSGMASRSELLTPPREQPLSPMKPMRPSLESLHKIIFPTYACLCSLGISAYRNCPRLTAASVGLPHTFCRA